MYENMRNCRERDTLMNEIGTISFVIDELRLFLDTHPNDREALELFNTNAKKRRELVCDYTETFGPLDAYSENTVDGWSWNCPPMPYEKEAN